MDFGVKSIHKLSDIAKKDPHSAFAAVSRSLQNEWKYIQRVVEESADSFLSLRSALSLHFLPQISGYEINDFDANLMMRPSRFCGIGIQDPVKIAPLSLDSSQQASELLQLAIISGEPVDIFAHNEHSKNKVCKLKKMEEEETLNEVKILLQEIPIERKEQQQHLTNILNNKCSAWLAASPWEDEYFSMTPDEFRDSMALRYGKTPKGLQTWCDGCGEKFDVNHGLDCKNGGLVYQRHNELRDENCDLNRKAGFSQVTKEPVIKEAGANGEGSLRGDWCVRGFWVPQRVAVFDTRIFNANAPSYKALSLEAAFNIHRNEKKNKYSEEVAHRRGSFTPIIATCEGILDREAEAYVKRLAHHLSKKWGKSSSKTIFWVRARMQMCILRSVSNCLRGSRIKWKGGNVEDGAAIPSFQE